ncbi:MAG: hypothetical protein ABI702_04340 [Burkholderiales bacterium]
MTHSLFTTWSMRGAALALLTVLAACGGGGSDTPASPAAGNGSDSPPPVVAGFTLALSAQKALILQGGSIVLDATVTRDAGFDGAVDVAVTGLPTGVTAPVVSIAKGSTTAHITLQAEGAAPHSLPTDAVVKGTSGASAAQRPVTVTVRGLPGALDTSFASNGKAITGLGADDYAEATALQSDGKLVVAGHANMGGATGTDFVLVRYLRDGAIDPSFGNAGKVSTDIDGGSDQAFAVALQPDGKIVVAGSSDVSPKGKSFAVVRYNTDGSLDATFGAGGKVVTSFGSQSDTAYAVAVQQDGRIVAGGHANTAQRGIDFALARYQANGTLDASFGNNGLVLAPIRALDSRDSIYAIALQTTGGEEKIVAVGGEGDFTVVRFNANGSLDAGFGIGQRLDGAFGTVIGAARAVMVTPEHKIVVTGHANHDFAVLQLNEDGIADEAFGGSGRVITKLSTTNWNEAHAVVRQADGKLVVGGWVYAGNGSSGDFAVVRYAADGTLDNAFGTGGVTITAVAPGGKADEGRAMVLQSDDRVPTVRSIVAGSANDANYDFAVTRYWN